MKTQLWTFVLACFIHSAAAQIPSWQWARSATFSDTSGMADGTGVALDPQDNVYITGTFYSPDIAFGGNILQNPGFTFNNNGSSIVAKYDSSGNILWATQNHGPGKSYASGITSDGFGNAYITGNFYNDNISFDTDTLINTCLQNIFLVKIDPSGQVEWGKALGDSNSNYSHSIASDPFGNVFITGTYFGTTLHFDSLSLTNSGHADLFITKYNSLGKALWTRSATSLYNDAEVSASVTSDQAGNAYITGYFSGPYMVFGTDTLMNAPFLYDFNMFLAKFDSAGNFQWARSSGGLGKEMGQIVAAHSSSCVYVSGLFTSPFIVFDTDTLWKNGPENVFLVKYSSTGNVLWAKSFNKSATSGLDVDAYDDVVISGEMFASFFIDSLLVPIIPGIDPMFIIKCSASGQPLWAKSLRSGGYLPHDVAAGSGGSIYFVSDFHIYNNNFIVGNDTLHRTGQSDIFVAKLGFPSTTGVTEYELMNEIMVYPNPANDFLNITTLNKSNETMIQLLNAQGQIVYFDNNFNEAPISISKFNNGIYLLKYTNKNTTILKKIVIHH